MLADRFWSIGIIQIWMSSIIHHMGHSREDKARSHQRIVDIAARRFRESGLAGPGVAELMQAAGLTHGGFYKHFGSRDDLVAEAVQRALTDREAEVAALLADAADPLAAFVDWYASTEHRDSPGRRAAGWSPSARTRRGRIRGCAPPTPPRCSATSTTSRRCSVIGSAPRRRSARWSGRCWWRGRSGPARCPRRSCGPPGLRSRRPGRRQGRMT